MGLEEGARVRVLDGLAVDPLLTLRRFSEEMCTVVKNVTYSKWVRTCCKWKELVWRVEPRKAVTCYRCRNQGREVSSLRYHFDYRLHRRAVFHLPESSTRHPHFRHSPETPSFEWIRLQTRTCYARGQLDNFFFHLPVLTSQSLTVPSSEEVITNLLLNCKHVTADWCLLAPRIFREFITFSYLSNCPLFFNRCKFLLIRSYANKNDTIGILTKWIVRTLTSCGKMIFIIILLSFLLVESLTSV